MDAIFNYPNYGTPNSYPDYTAHSGQPVEVVHQLPPEEYDFQGERMFKVQAADGWTGSTWESELDPPPPMTPEDVTRLTEYEGDYRSQGQQANKIDGLDRDNLGDSPDY